MDGLGSNIDINNRGSEVMRILPRINEEVNEEWISDKSRHAFDGLKHQRLTVPMSRNEDGSFAELRWDEAMDKARNAFSKVSGEEIVGIIGQFADLESIVSLRDLLHRAGCEHLEVRADAPKLSADFRN
jgi:NADH dehydrogenase (ubiquinone) Fe-S protein 1